MTLIWPWLYGNHDSQGQGHRLYPHADFQFNPPNSSWENRVERFSHIILKNGVCRGHLFTLKGWQKFSEQKWTTVNVYPLKQQTIRTVWPSVWCQLGVASLLEEFPRMWVYPSWRHWMGLKKVKQFSLYDELCFTEYFSNVLTALLLRMSWERQ